MPTLLGKDELEAFELNLPFARTHINNFVEKVDEAEKAAGGNGSVTIDTLKAQFTTPAWGSLANQDSVLSKILLSDSFKNAEKGQAADQIDRDWLVCYGIIHCAGKPMDKAIAFYNILQEGGLDAHTNISAGDKDLIPVFKQMSDLLTIHAFAFAKLGGISEKYSEDELSALGESHEIVREDQLLEDIYGASSRLENQEFLQKLCKDAVWVFSAKELRKRLLEAASLPSKY
jgi:hypothetical protein